MQLYHNLKAQLIGLRLLLTRHRQLTAVPAPAQPHSTFN